MIQQYRNHRRHLQGRLIHLKQNEQSGHQGKSHKIILLILAGILLLSPYFHGLFFDQETLYFTFVIGIITALTVDTRFKKIEKIDLMDAGFFILTVWYLISLPFAVNKGSAILGTLRILSYFALYYTASRTLTRKTIRLGAWLLALSGTLVTLVGIGSSINLPRIVDGWGKMLCSSFQYHNALGGYLLMVIPVSLLLYRDAQRWWTRYLALMTLYMGLLGLIGSQSRGAYIFLVLSLALSLMAFRRKDLPLLYLLSVVIWASLDDWTQVYWAGNLKSYAVLLWPFAGLSVVWLAEWLWHDYKNHPSYRLRQIVGAVLVASLLVIGTLPLIASLNTHGSTIARVQSINAQDPSWLERLSFYETSLKMSFEKPLVGFGANGWEFAYQSYQNHIFYSKGTHSEPLEILVETGFPGLLFYLILWLGFLKYLLKSWKSRHKNMSYLLSIAVLGIFLHSLMDFDLSLSSIFFTLILLLASIQADSNQSIYRVFSKIRMNEPLNLTTSKRRLSNNSFFPQSRLNPRKWTISQKWIAPGIMLPLAFILILASPLLKAGLDYAEQGNQAFNDQQYEMAMKLDQMALKYFPYQSSVFEDLAKVEISSGVQTSNQQLITQALSDMNQAITLNPLNPLTRSTAASVYATANKLDIAYLQAQKNRELADLFPIGYEMEAYYTILYAEQLLLTNKVSEAQPLLRQVLNLSTLIEQRLAKVSEKDKKRWYAQPHLTVTSRLELYRGEAFALLGDQENALKTLTSVSTDETLKLEALVWKGSIEKLQGDPQGELDLAAAQTINPRILDNFQSLGKLLAIGHGV